MCVSLFLNRWRPIFNLEQSLKVALPIALSFTYEWALRSSAIFVSDLLKRVIAVLEEKNQLE